MEPARSASEATISWTPDSDLSTVMLATSPLGPNASSLHPDIRLVATGAADTDGERPGLIPGLGEDHHVLMTDAARAAPLAAIIPLDGDTLDRLTALERLWRSIVQPETAPPPRLTPQRRRRLRHMLQAVDARAAGASHRQLAQVLFGEARIAAEPWKTSALRDTTLRLARDGAALVDHGYRKLLRLT